MVGLLYYLGVNTHLNDTMADEMYTPVTSGGIKHPKRPISSANNNDDKTTRR